MKVSMRSAGIICVGLIAVVQLFVVATDYGSKKRTGTSFARPNRCVVVETKAVSGLMPLIDHMLTTRDEGISCSLGIFYEHLALGKNEVPICDVVQTAMELIYELTNSVVVVDRAGILLSDDIVYEGLASLYATLQRFSDEDANFVYLDIALVLKELRSLLQQIDERRLVQVSVYRSVNVQPTDGIRQIVAAIGQKLDEVITVTLDELLDKVCTVTESLANGTIMAPPTHPGVGKMGDAGITTELTEFTDTQTVIAESGLPDFDYSNAPFSLFNEINSKDATTNEWLKMLYILVRNIHNHLNLGTRPAYEGIGGELYQPSGATQPQTYDTRWGL